jgi:hypothetical protein
MVRLINNSEYNNLKKNGAVDLITQEDLKDIPRNRLVYIGQTPFNVHSLRHYLKYDTKNPLTGNSFTKREILDIKKLASNTNWRNSSWNNNEPLGNRSLTKKEKIAIKMRFLKHTSQMIDRRLSEQYKNSTAPMIKRVKSIAAVLLTSNTTRYQFNLPHLGVTINLKKSINGNKKPCVKSIEIVWTTITRKRKLNGTRGDVQTKYNKVHLLSPKMVDPSINVEWFQPKECIQRDVLFTQAHNIQWLVHFDDNNSNAPGNRGVTYKQITDALIRAIGFSTHHLNDSSTRPQTPTNNNNIANGTVDFGSAFLHYYREYENNVYQDVSRNVYDNALNRVTNGDLYLRMTNLLGEDDDEGDEMQMRKRRFLGSYANVLTHIVYKFPQWGRRMARTTSSYRAFQHIKIIKVQTSIGRIRKTVTVRQEDHVPNIIFNAVQELLQHLSHTNNLYTTYQIMEVNATYTIVQGSRGLVDCIHHTLLLDT